MRRAAVTAVWMAAVLGAAAQARAEDKVVERDLGQADKAYRVIMPGDVKPGEKLPLVVYLHPTGQANFEQVQKDWWPVFRAHRFLMVMPRSRGKRMWLADEGQFVADCIQHAQGMYTLDPKNVLLMGVSGGGQVALFLADHTPKAFRAVILLGTNPVVVRGRRSVWFYPNEAVRKTCPYFVTNHLSEGSALMYWRQVRAKLAGSGASISIRPRAGEPTGHYAPPPPQFAPWLKEVLAGKQPKELPDLQGQAVAKLFEPTVAALVKALAAGAAAPAGKPVVKPGVKLDLRVTLPAGYVRSEREDRADSTGDPLTQIRFEHEKWPVYVRVEGSATKKPMADVLAAEEAEARTRGMLYQIYHKATVTAGGRSWRVKIGSMTFPDRRTDEHGKPRGWISILFVHGATALRADGRQWLATLVMDYTGKPDAAEMAKLFHTAAAVKATPPTAKPEAAKPAPSR